MKLKTLKSAAITWLCIASANPEHLTAKEHQYFLNGVYLLCLSSFTALVFALNIMEWLL
jgi:hypothetical protein